jgi:hypothetical protein
MSKQQFDNCPKKRRVNREQTARLVIFNFGTRNDCLLSVPGPNPEKAMEIFDEYSVYNTAILVENDPEIYNQTKDIQLLKGIKVRRQEFSSAFEEYKNQITIIDDDRYGAFDKQKQIASENYFNKSTSDFLCLRINGATRTKGGDDTVAMTANNICILANKNWYVLDIDFQEYCDSSPMRVLQLVLERKSANLPETYKRLNKEEQKQYFSNVQQNQKKIEAEKNKRPRQSSDPVLRDYLQTVVSTYGEQKYYPYPYKERIMKYVLEEFCIHNRYRQSIAKELGISIITLNSWFHRMAREDNSYSTSISYDEAWNLAHKVLNKNNRKC